MSERTASWFTTYMTRRYLAVTLLPAQSIRESIWIRFVPKDIRQRTSYRPAHGQKVTTFRSSQKKAIADSHAKLKSVGIDINDLRNGFWAKTGHLGSHKEKYFVEMGKALRNTKTRREVEDALMSLKRRLQAGEFR